MKSFLIEFLGCKVNSYEVEAIANELISAGYSLCSSDNIPDIVIINTCSVTKTSGGKSRKIARHYRKLYKNAVLVIMGCDSQRDSKAYIDDVEADIIIGTSLRNKLVDLIEQFLAEKKKICEIKDMKNGRNFEKMSVNHFLFNTRAYVKIQDGCDNFCTYCLIPYVRGRSRSRDKNEILNEIEVLVENGYSEIVLTGIDMCSYGQDFDYKYSFSDLLGDILEKNPKLYRLRISSIEESQIDDKFIYLLKKYDNLANHLHIPLQSGSIETLKKMNRKYDLVSYQTKIAKIRSIRPDISITTDVIVGFPTESLENFNETYDFCKKIGFSKIHVFPYSDRDGTIASKIYPKVSIIEKKNRVAQLISLSNALEEEYRQKFIGKKIEFLFENFDETTKSFRGHSSNYLEIFYKSNDNLNGKVLAIIFE